MVEIKCQFCEENSIIEVRCAKGDIVYLCLMHKTWGVLIGKALISLEEKLVEVLTEDMEPSEIVISIESSLENRKWTMSLVNSPWKDVV